MNDSMTLSGAGFTKPNNDQFSAYSFEKKHTSLTGIPSNSGLSGSTAAYPNKDSLKQSRKAKKIRNAYISESDIYNSMNNDNFGYRTSKPS